MSKDDFGLKLGVQGEKEFKSALVDINRNFRVLGSEMKLVESQFDKNDRSVQALASRNEVLNKQIDAQKGKIETLRSALKNASESFGENDRRTQNWQAQLNNAEAALNGMERELKQNTKEMDDLRKSTDKASKTADDSKNRFAGLGETLKSVGAALGAAVAAIGTAAVAAGKKVYDMADATAAAGDEIDKQSQKLGISAENYQKLSYAMERSRADVEDFRKGTANITKELANMQNGVDGAGSMFNQLGISVQNADGSFKSTEDVLLSTIDALSKMEDETQRNALAQSVFGRSYQELLPLLNSGSDGIRQLMNEAEKYGMVMSDKAVKASAAFKDSLTKLDGTINGVKNNLMSKFLPSLTKVTDGLSELFAGNGKGSGMIKSGIESALKTASDMIPQIVGLLGTIGGAILESAPEILRSLSSSIIGLLPDFFSVAFSDVLPDLVSVTVGIIGELVSSLSTALPDILVSLSEGLVTIVNELFSPENLTNTVDIIIVAIEGVIGGLRQALPILIQGATTLVQGLITALPEVISLLTNEIPNILDMLFNSEHGLLSADNVGKLVDGAVDAVIALVDNLPTIISNLIGAIPDIIDRLFDEKNGFLNFENINKLVHGAIEVIKELVKNMPKIILRLLLEIPHIIDKITDAFSSIVSDFTGIGEDAINGFFSGLWSALTAGGYGQISSIRSSILSRFNSDGEFTIGFSGGGRAFAEGGVVDKPTWGVFGEAGTEAIIPLKNNTEWIYEVAKEFASINATLSRDMYIGAFGNYSNPRAVPNYNVNINFGDVTINDGSDVENIAHQVSDIIVSDIITQGGAYA